MKIDRIEGIESFWHGLNAVRPQGELNTFEGSALDWEIIKRPLVWGGNKKATELIFNKEGEEVERQLFGLESGGNILSQVEDSYGITQNIELYEIIKTLIGEFGANVESCGSIHGRKKVFWTISMPESSFSVGGKDDLVRHLVSLISGHDKTGSILTESLIRAVCANTVKAIMKGVKQLNGDALVQRFRKSKNVGERIKIVKANAIHWAANRENLADSCNALASKSIVRADMELFSYGFLGSISTKGALSTRTKNTSKVIVDLAYTGKGNATLDGEDKTRWSLLNGFTEYYTHNTSDNTQKAFLSSEFGAASKVKAALFPALLDDSELDRLCAEGERLLKQYEERGAEIEEEVEV